MVLSTEKYLGTGKIHQENKLQENIDPLDTYSILERLIKDEENKTKVNELICAQLDRLANLFYL